MKNENMDRNINSLIIKENNTIKDAMELIEKTGLRIILVVDDNKKLLGIATDGDIRRALLVDKDFESPIKKIMVEKPVTAQKGTPAKKLLEIMLEKTIQEIPIVDERGILLDIVLFRDLKNIPLSSPDITHREVEIINQVLSTPFLSIGPKIKEFEKKVADYIGTKYAVAVNSGTSGLHLCIRSLGIADGDEVITSPFSFIASANCMLFERAKPVFVDIDKDTLCLDVDKIEEKITPRTKAILPVHIFGHPCEMQKIMEIAKKHNLAVVEDACEALGSEYENKKAGTFGNAAVFAFYPNKQITSVTYDTPVMVRRNGVVELVKIGSLMDFMIDKYWKPDGYECLAFNENGRILWQKIEAFIKHNINTEILKIYLEKGRETEITKSHSVFTIKEGEIKEVLGRDLKIGDYLIVPRRLPILVNPIKEIDILNYINRQNVKFNHEKVIIKNNEVGGGGGKYTGRKIKINEDFCKLLGYFIAEGGYELDKSGGGLRFTFGLHEKNTYVKEVKDIVSSIWPSFKPSIIEDKKRNKCTVLCGGLIHSELFKNLGCRENVYSKSIPNIIWEVNDKNKLAFIEGLLKGDGHERMINGSESKKIKVASENLANGLHYLLLTLGVQSRLEKKKYYSKKRKSCCLYVCEVLGFDNQLTSKENCVPKEFLSLTSQSSHIQKERLRNKKSVSLKTLENWIEQGKISCPHFLLNDIAVLKIKRIEKKKIHNFVYDFEVKKSQNFIGGYGAICLHNTGEGGVVVTNDEKIAKLCQSMRNQGRDEGDARLAHSRLGYNYRMTEISAALGVVQMERISDIFKKRQEVADIYNKRLSKIEGVKIPYVGSDVKLSWFVYVIKLDEKRFSREDRNEIIREMGNRGISCRDYFPPIHLEPFYTGMFGYKEGDFPLTENVSRSTIALPFYNNLTEKEIEYVCDSLADVLNKISKK